MLREGPNPPHPHWRGAPISRGFPATPPRSSRATLPGHWGLGGGGGECCYCQLQGKNNERPHPPPIRRPPALPLWKAPAMTALLTQQILGAPPSPRRTTASTPTLRSSCNDHPPHAINSSIHCNTAQYLTILDLTIPYNTIPYPPSPSGDRQHSHFGEPVPWPPSTCKCLAAHSRFEKPQCPASADQQAHALLSLPNFFAPEQMTAKHMHFGSSCNGNPPHATHSTNYGDPTLPQTDDRQHSPL